MKWSAVFSEFPKLFKKPPRSFYYVLWKKLLSQMYLFKVMILLQGFDYDANKFSDKGFLETALRIKIEYFTGHMCTTCTYLNLYIANEHRQNLNVCYKLYYFMYPSLCSPLHHWKKAPFCSGWRSYLQTLVILAIESSPHRIPDTFLKKRSHSLITELCPTLVWHCSLYEVYTCEVVKNKRAANGQCFSERLSNFT